MNVKIHYGPFANLCRYEEALSDDIPYTIGYILSAERRNEVIETMTLMTAPDGTITERLTSFVALY